MEIPDEIVVPSSELEKLRERAFAGLERNCVPVFGSGGKRVLTEGGIYTGIWLECGPHESLTLAPLLPEVALMSHRIFYLHQREDGQFPAYILGDRAGYSQIQQVVPIAATAWELAQMTGSGVFCKRAMKPVPDGKNGWCGTVTRAVWICWKHGASMIPGMTIRPAGKVFRNFVPAKRRAIVRTASCRALRRTFPRLFTGCGSPLRKWRMLSDGKRNRRNTAPPQNGPAAISGNIVSIRSANFILTGFPVPDFAESSETPGSVSWESMCRRKSPPTGFSSVTF